MFRIRAGNTLDFRSRSNYITNDQLGLVMIGGDRSNTAEATLDGQVFSYLPEVPYYRMEATCIANADQGTVVVVGYCCQAAARKVISYTKGEGIIR